MKIHDRQRSAGRGMVYVSNVVFLVKVETKLTLILNIRKRLLKFLGNNENKGIEY